MKFFIDTADVGEIKEAHALGILDGVTTNPSLIKKSGRPFDEVAREICALVPGPVSLEVTSIECDGMLAEADKLLKYGENVVIKLPLIPEGLKACKRLSEQGVKTNVTLCFQPVQALLAAKAGATYISPFVGRLDDLGQDGMGIIPQIRQIYDNYGFETEILVASIRNPIHVLDAALVGADVATIPFSVFKQLVHHPLTDKGLAQFLADWKAVKA
ncbi:MAG: fructose-6-phosphate aldolase [Planctomycetota bacterium]|nr:fructose-6-phosphate aldolase [Planctomycetota bacterium]